MQSIRSFISGLMRRPRGHLDHVDRTRASGWAALPSNEPGPASISLYVDGHLSKSFSADLPRTDVAARGGPLHCGFDVSLNDAVAVGGRQRLEFRIGANGPVLKNGSVLLDSAEVTGAADIPDTARQQDESADHDARVETIDVSGIRGWVRGMQEGMQIGLLMDADLISVVRPVPAASGLKAAFTLELPISFYDGRTHDILVVDMDTRQPLPGGVRLNASPFDLGTDAMGETDGTLALAPDISPETAFAILYLAEDGLNVSVYTNAENCLVVTAHSQLRKRAGSEATTGTPVVVIDRTTPQCHDYVLQAVRRHWRFGGRYATTAALLDLARGASGLRLRELAEDDIGHTTFRGLMTLPMELAKDTCAPFASERVSADTFFFVAPPSDGANALAPREMGRLQARVSACKLAPEEGERIVRNNGIAIAADLGDWPIRHILRRYRGPSLAGICREGEA